MPQESITTTDLDVHENLAFQRRAWIVERISWVAMSLLLILTMLGLFATGPLASTTRTDASQQISVSYERFVRHQGHVDWSVEVQRLTVDQQSIDLFISSDLLREQTIEQFIPEPSSSRVAPDGFYYTFDIDPEALPGPVRIHVHSTVDGLGALDGRVGLLRDDGAVVDVDLWMFAYP